MKLCEVKIIHDFWRIFNQIAMTKTLSYTFNDVFVLIATICRQHFVQFNEDHLNHMVLGNYQLCQRIQVCTFS